MNEKWATVGFILSYLGIAGVVSRAWYITRLDSDELERWAHDQAYGMLMSAALVVVGITMVLITTHYVRRKAAQEEP